MPSILRQAVDLNIKLTTMESFLQLIDEFETTLNSKKQTNLAPQKVKTEKRIDTLTAPFLKFEDDQRLFCPEYKQFSNWPMIFLRPGEIFLPLRLFAKQGSELSLRHFLGAKGTPFEQRSPMSVEEPDEISKADENETNKTIVGKVGAKTRILPKRTMKRQRRKRGDFSGYCDLCHCFAENVDDVWKNVHFLIF